MLTRRTLILAKQETTSGVVATGINATDNALLVSNCNVQPQSEMLERDLYLSTLSPLGSVTGIYWGQMTFDTEFRGMGSIPTGASPATTLREDPLFKCCGLSAHYAAGSAVYMPFSDFETVVISATLYAYLDGILHVMVGAMGNMQMAGTVGQYGKYTWTLQGAIGDISYPYVPVTDAIRDEPMPTPTYQNFNLRPPALLDTDMNIMGGQQCVQAFNFNMNNNVVRRDCMKEPSGIHGFMITARKPGGTMNPEATLRSIDDYWGRWKNNVGGPITFHVGNALGNTMDWAMPNSQWTRLGYGDRNGIRTYEMEYQACMVSDAGDDEVQIGYK